MQEAAFKPFTPAEPVGNDPAIRSKPIVCLDHVFNKSSVIIPQYSPPRVSIFQPLFSGEAASVRILLIECTLGSLRALDPVVDPIQDRSD